MPLEQQPEHLRRRGHDAARGAHEHIGKEALVHQPAREYAGEEAQHREHGDEKGRVVVAYVREEAEDGTQEQKYVEWLRGVLRNNPALLEELSGELLKGREAPEGSQCTSEPDDFANACGKTEEANVSDEESR